MKPGRNDPCPCGSGKKFKKCCQDKLEASAAPPEQKIKKANRAEKQPTTAEINQLVTLFNAGQHAEAERQTRLLLTRHPASGNAWKVLGVFLHRQGKEAIAALRKAVECLPDDAEAHNNLASALGDIGRFTESAESCRRALEIKPDSAEAHHNLGTAMLRSEQFDDAVSSCRKALEIKPDYIKAHINLSTALFSLGKLEESELSYRHALQIEPDNAVYQSDFLYVCSNNAKYDAATLFAEHIQFGEQFETPLRANWPMHTNSRNPERCLQVGIVSGDLYTHAVASFIEPVLSHLAGVEQLSLHAYYNHTIEDAVTQRLQRCFAHWHPIAGLSDIALAEKIQFDGIDILIDLSGHTARNRLLTFARKPAPVQASWMGYPGTTGLSAIDYYLADRFFLPPGEFDSQFTEKIVHLPAIAPFLPSEHAPAVNTLPALSNSYVTFGSFNRLSKINQPVIALWSQLLRALPDSRMVLGGMPEEGKYDTLIKWFAQEGIARERLVFHTRIGMDRYMALHHQVDICLDTFPYNGGTTTLHAQWMGVPTLTLTGCTVAGRPGACILGHVGRDDFIAHDAADFVQKGLSWAENLAALSDIRAGLRERFANSAMGQPAVVAAGVERGLRIMWQRWCDKLPAESFEVNLTSDLQSDLSAQLAIEQALHQAVAQQQSGQLQVAEALYRGILQLNPSHPEANHNLGLLAVQTQQPVAGLPYFIAALDADPARGQYWLSYVDALLQADQLEDARQILELARQQGLQGAGVEALVLRLEAGTQVTAKDHHTSKEFLLIPSVITHEVPRQESADTTLEAGE
ncbi:MAG: tetratricopeptide repeat protein [Gallionella sp.]|nr:tetratricopeptide repeat protein [Gallionella sp.]